MDKKRLGELQSFVFDAIIVLARETDRGEVGAGRPSAFTRQEQLELTLAYWRRAATLKSVVQEYDVSLATLQRSVRRTEGRLLDILADRHSMLDLIEIIKAFAQEALILTLPFGEFQAFKYAKPTRTGTVYNRDDPNRISKGASRVQEAQRQKLDRPRMALVLFDQHFHNRSVKQVCRRWEISRATYFRHKKAYFEGELTWEALWGVFPDSANVFRTIGEYTGRDWRAMFLKIMQYRVRKRASTAKLSYKHEEYAYTLDVLEVQPNSVVAPTLLSRKKADT